MLGCRLEIQDNKVLVEIGVFRILYVKVVMSSVL